nr:DUF1934 domain-containing protein [Bacillus aquiflavi]
MLPLSNRSAEQMPVKIKIKTTIWNEEGKNTAEFITFGKYIKKENTAFLQYDEVQEQGKINTIVKLSNNKLFIMRSGAVKMKLLFRQDKQLSGLYDTPYGKLTMTTLTKRLDYFHDMQKSVGNIELLYDLNVQGSRAGTYHLLITYTEVLK